MSSSGTESPPLIRLRGVDRTYPGHPPIRALRGCDLTVGASDYLAITGASGSGKSTLLNVLGLLDRPTHGSYEYDGVDVASLSEARRSALRARRLGFVFQSFNLLPHRSALENVALAQTYLAVPRRQRRDNAMRVLARVGLEARAHSLTSQLSGGEKQRVAISRALLNAPPLLLCDEPTGNLDSANTREVLTILDELHADGQSIVVITHDADVAARAARRAHMDDGVLSLREGDDPRSTAVTPMPSRKSLNEHQPSC